MKITEAQSLAGLMAFGIPEEYAKELAGMERLIKDGKEERVNDVVEVVTGKKPIGLKEFVARNRGAWEKK